MNRLNGLAVCERVPVYRLTLTATRASEPFETDYPPYRQPKDDSEALNWAAHMQESVGAQWAVTLYRDDVVLVGGQTLADPSRQPLRGASRP